MNDLGGGVHVGNVDNSEWEKDDDVGGLVQVLFEDGATAGGLWAAGPDPHVAKDHVLPARETIVILEGTVRIEIQDGPTLELGRGDVASMPRGATTTWHPSPDFKEVWLYS
jgi:uncharacterized cupin superfamily protein